jgi:hypothetical protein
VLLALTALRERDCGLDRQQLDGTWAQTAEQVRQLDASLASHLDHLEESGAGIYAALRAELAHAGQVSA